MISLIQSGPPPLGMQADLLRSANTSFSMDEPRSYHPNPASLGRVLSRSDSRNTTDIPVARVPSINEGQRRSKPLEIDATSDSTVKNMNPNARPSPSIGLRSNGHLRESISQEDQMIYNSRPFESSPIHLNQEVVSQQAQLDSRPSFVLESPMGPSFKATDFPDAESFLDDPRERIDDDDIRSKIVHDGSFLDTQQVSY
jgi:hypothetical protein